MKKALLILGRHVVSPQKPLPHVYPTTSGWGIKKTMINTQLNEIIKSFLNTMWSRLWQEIKFIREHIEFLDFDKNPHYNLISHDNNSWL